MRVGAASRIEAAVGYDTDHVYGATSQGKSCECSPPLWVSELSTSVQFL